MVKKKPLRKLIGIEKQLFDAIQQSELTLNAIALGAGIARPQLHHFIARTRGIQLATAASLCTFLGLELAREAAAPLSPSKSLGYFGLPQFLAGQNLIVAYGDLAMHITRNKIPKSLTGHLVSSIQKRHVKPNSQTT